MILRTTLAVTVCRKDMYYDIIEKAFSQLNMSCTTSLAANYDVNDLVLVKASGAIISNDVLKSRGGLCKEWTLGGYLDKLHLAPHKLRLGIGFIEKRETVRT